MIEDPREGDSPSVRNSWPRPRFGLKAVFIVITILCLWLGWYMARRQRAAEIADRSLAVWDVVEQNMNAGPSNTSFVFPDPMRQSMMLSRRTSRPNREQYIKTVSGLFGNRGIESMMTLYESLVITDLLTTAGSTDVSSQLMQHYEHGLAELGLHRITTGNQRPSTATSLWQQNEHGINVLIDIAVRPEIEFAEVRVIFLHNERISVW